MTGPRAKLSSAALAVFLLLPLLTACQPNQPAPAANGTSVMNVADAAIAGGNPDMALKISQSILASDPSNLDALFHEAAAYYAVGRCEDAIAAYKLALNLDPHSSEAQTGIGRCLLKHNAAAAEQAFAAAVQDDPRNAAALNDLGIARDLQGNYAGATQPYQQSLLVQPGILSTEVNLGLSLALSGDAADALDYLGPLATGAQANPRIRQDYAIALLAAGRRDEALQVLTIDLPPDQANQILTTITPMLGGPPQAVTPTPTTTAPIVNTPPVLAAPLPSAPAVSGMDDVIVR